MKKHDVLSLQNVQGHVETNDFFYVLVNKKLKLNTIQRYIKNPNKPWSEKDIVPEHIKTGVFSKKKTKVLEIGNVKALVDRKKYRPLQGGCEISPQGRNWVGTAGCIVRVKQRTGSLGIRSLYFVDAYYYMLDILKKFGLETKTIPAFLTNAHVTEEDMIKPKHNTKITQPYNNSVIGKTIYAVPFLKGKKQEYDCSLVSIEGQMIQEQIITVGVPQGIKDVRVGESVHKYGRTTAYTTGTCIARDVTTVINYGDNGLFTFTGLDMYSRMSAGGDSGSVIVAQDDNKIVSLLFAGSDSVTFGIPFKKIVDKLHIEI